MRSPIEEFRKRYDAVAFRDRTWWMIEIPELGTTPALSRSEVASQACDLIAVWLDIDEKARCGATHSLAPLRRFA